MVRVEAEQAGQRLDNFLAACFRQVPRSRLYRSVRSGEVRVNKGRVRQDYRLREGDLVRLPPLRTPPASTPAAPSAGLRAVLDEAVLMEDQYLLVLNKPSGLAVHGGSGQSLGLIEAMREMRPDLRYLELVWRGGGRRIDRALSRHSGRNGERMVRVDRAGRDSSTAFTPLAAGESASYMEARPHTGRTHQIRVHAAALDMPVAGDDRYGDREFNARMRAEHGLKRLFLHASSLRFSHPNQDSKVVVDAPLPRELKQVVDALGLRPES
jgi:23S rRNA pseudouridine955/2504/2580 synthase